jgi:hypothetical protein
MPQPLDSKGESLRHQGVLNPHPQKVADPLFLRGEFFDPRDLVQVKYEMLRRVRVEGASGLDCFRDQSRRRQSGGGDPGWGNRSPHSIRETDRCRDRPGLGAANGPG